jgi:hypothetical protein
MPMKKKTNVMSIIGFCVSLTSCFILGLYGLTGLAGVILSAIGRKQSIDTGDHIGLSTAGIILGIVSIVLAIMSLMCSSCITSVVNSTR